METFVELLMLKKEDHLYFSLYVILFEILILPGEKLVYTHFSGSRGKNEYVTPAITYIYTTVSFIVIIHSQVHVSTQMFYHARISVVSYLFNRFVHVFQIRFKHFPTNQGEIHFYCSLFKSDFFFFLPSDTLLHPDENWNVLGSTLPCLLFLGRLASIPTRSCDGPTEHSRKRETPWVPFWAIILREP
jgi:hypothetical protein